MKLQYIISSALLIGKSLLLVLKTPLMSILSGYLCEIFYCYGLWKEGIFAHLRSNDAKDFFSFLLLRKILIQLYFIEYRRATSAIWSKGYLSNLTGVDNNWLSFNSLSDFVLFYFVLIFIPSQNYDEIKASLMQIL